jgi:hypothetical protein
MTLIGKSILKTVGLMAVLPLVGSATVQPAKVQPAKVQPANAFYFHCQVNPGGVACYWIV